MARARHPGQRNSLDALCKRYGVDNSGRELHGAFHAIRTCLHPTIAACSGWTMGGGCGIGDPNLNDQPAVARPPPDIPFKPGLQEDNGSVRPGQAPGRP